MRTDDLRESLDSIVPETNGTILTSRGDDVTWRGHLDIMDGALMTNKSIRSHGSFEVPDHNSTVIRTRHDLFQIRIEGNTVDCVFVAFERSF